MTDSAMTPDQITGVSARLAAGPRPGQTQEGWLADLGRDVRGLLAHIKVLTDERDFWRDERDQEHWDRVTRERDRFQEHSVTLNTVAWKIAEAVGDVAEGQERIEGNPVEQAERLIRMYKATKGTYAIDRQRISNLIDWCAHNLGRSHLHREIRRLLEIPEKAFPWQLPEPPAADVASVWGLLGIDSAEELDGNTPIESPADEHPEMRCGRCGGPNVRAWCAPSPLWNQVMRGGDINAADQFGGIVCPACFAQLAEEAGIAQRWRFYAERVHVELATTTPSGRVWNPQTWLWEEPAPSVDGGEACTGRPITPGVAADGMHCDHWYDGGPCCRCDAPAQPTTSEE